MIKNWRRRFVFFALVGALATGIQYAILILSVELLQINPVVGSCAGYLTSASVSYIFNYHFTFNSNHSHLGAAVRFAVVSGTGLLLNGAIMYGLVHSFGMIYIFAQVIATALVLIWNFLGSALWTFDSANRRMEQG